MRPYRVSMAATCPRRQAVGSGALGEGRALEGSLVDWITDTIAIGNIEDAMDTAGLNAAGITAVLCLNGFPYGARAEGVTWMGVTLTDGAGNSMEQLEAAVGALQHLSNSHNVLVHCMEGLSRSVLIVACHLAQERSISLDAAIEEVRRSRKRAQVDHGLRSLLKDGWPPARAGA